MPPAKDIFMQFADIVAKTDAADSSALEETMKNTQMQARGGLIWLIHAVWVWVPEFTANFYELIVALQTHAGLATMPGLAQHGTIVKFRAANRGTAAAGYARVEQPGLLRCSFLPPFPLGAASLSAYVQGGQDHADGRNLDVDIRIGYTTAPVDDAMYIELHEAWGY